MKLPGLLYKICEVDVTELEHHVKRLTDHQWIEWDLRQHRYKVHAATESYPFIFSEYGEEPKTYNLDTEIWNTVMPIVTKIEKLYNKKAIIVVLVKLKPGTNIRPHTDGGWYVNTHRIHIPVITDPRIKFILDDKEYHMEPGYGYEMNNMVNHGVVNPTNIGRVHLMIDLIPSSIVTNINYQQTRVL